jgi:dipeptidyl aminopeptidase/acylaminoacyl peptidase
MRQFAVKIAILALILSVMALIGLGLLASEQRRILYPGVGAAGTTWIELPAGYRTVTLRTGDGLALRALYRPAAPGKRTIVHFHGNGETVQGAAREIEPLVDAGYGALLAEYRGYAGNPGAPDEHGLYRDGEAAISFLRQAGIADSQTIILGYSLGSGVAGRMAERHRPAALILIAPFTSVPEAAADHFGRIPAMLVQDRFATLSRIGKIDCPILLIHGAEDGTVLPENSRVLARATRDATLKIVPGQGHVIAYDPIAPGLMLGWLRERGL